MLRHTFKRLLVAIPVLWFMVSVIFLLSRILPGTFGQQIIQGEEGFYGKGIQQDRTIAYQQLLERTNQQLPVFYVSLTPLSVDASSQNYSYLVPDLAWHGTQNQYHLWAYNLLTGSLGESFASARPVSSMIKEAATSTFWVLTISMVLTVLLALALGTSMMLDTGIKLRRLILPSLVVIDSFPFFVLCLLFLLLFANPDMLQLFPAFGLGYTLPQHETGFINALQQFPYYVLPILCLVLANLPYLTNQFYTSLAGTMQADYIRTAHAKGLTPYQVITRHALRNALLPVITILSDMLPALVAGSVVIEVIFAIPGIGRLLVTSVLARDFPVIVGIVVIIALVKMLSHIVADICYALADPRIKHAAK